MIFNRLFVGLAIGSCLAFVTACSEGNSKPTDSHSAMPSVTTKADPLELTVATWNAEHLAFPIDEGCKPRTQEENAKLQRYVQSLNADIVALQEVASVKAVESIFPKSEWHILMSKRADSKVYDCRESQAKSTQQKVAFAIRHKVKVIDSQSIGALALNSAGLRHGLEITVESLVGPLTLLNVHMKSGCFVDNYSRSDSKACEIFAQQAPVLDKWVEKKEQEGMPYLILGDFNHRLSAPYNHLTRQLSTNSDDSASSLVNLGKDIIGCHPYYPAPIDHIFAGNLPKQSITTTVNMHTFKDMAPKAMLSDHCALSVQLAKTIYPLSAAVKWHTQSKEYGYLTSSIYQRAIDILNDKTLPKTSWVVVMDVDETVLDNSQYQVIVETDGVGYTPKTWDEWVASEKAILVPGVDDFIKTVFQRGGKIALVTNRKREQDKHTWNNLKRVGLPVTTNNTCLIGRNNNDKSAVDGQNIINDKDLRRQQLEDGSASCYVPSSHREILFPAQQIIMQVGDNIEDFSGITQEDANIKKLLPSAKTELILLPNSIYGSW